MGGDDLFGRGERRAGDECRRPFERWLAYGIKRNFNSSCKTPVATQFKAELNKYSGLHVVATFE